MKRTLIRALLMLTAIAVLAAVPAMAAKPTPKNKATKGTTQLKGTDNAQVGTTYTLGKANPINITLNSITYTVEPMAIGELQLAKGNEKLMLLNFTLHNPNKSNFSVVWSCLTFTAVDSNNKNYVNCSNIVSADNSVKGLVTLLPGQKSTFHTTIKVPAKAVIPKLIIESRDRLVLRYPLTNKNVKPLPAPIADPADKTGFTALEDVPAKIGEYYPIGVYTTKLESAVFSDTPIKGSNLKPDNRYLVMILSVRNDTPFKQGLAWSTFEPRLLDQDGMEVTWNGTVLYASRDESIGAPSLEPKQEVRIRYFYQVPTNLGLKSCSIRYRNDGRCFTYDLSTLK